MRVLVGSQAHGLATEKSDFDWRGVFIYKTSEILTLNAPKDQTSWIEGKEDDTSWELSKFLLMATKCNPTILEAFLAPRNAKSEWGDEEEKYGEELRALFPHVWNSVDVHNAFVGYGLNQRKKFLEDKDKRSPKYACAYLRTLYNAWELLSTGTFSVDMREAEIFSTLKLWKSGQFTLGGVINKTHEWEEKVHKTFDSHAPKKTNIEPINEFILKVRRDNW
jgi:predicted nucleotidyltransferase